MSVPQYYEFMPSIIRCLGDGEIHTLKELVVYCANDMKLTDEDKAETLSSGENTLHNRVSWAKTYLKKAGLIQSPKRACFTLSDKGRNAFNKGAECVTLKYLEQFDAFVAFKGKSASNNNNTVDASVIETTSPQEQIESALNELNEELASDLMTEIMKMTPYEFERLVVKLLIKMGYGKPEENKDAVTAKSGDEGIDGIVSSNKFGFDSIYIQAKQWKNDSTVGRPEIQKFLGALAGQGATKGIFITTAKFSKEAEAYAAKQLHSKIVLVDGERLTKLMIEFDLGVSTVHAYLVKRIDSDFFSDDV